MALLAEMVVKIGADVSKLEAGLTRAKAGVKDFGSKTENIRAGMTGVGKAGMVMGAGIGLGLGVAVRAGADFDKRMSKVKALSGATGKDFAQLRAQAIKLGADTSFSAGEAADGMANLAASGMTTKQTLAAMPGVLDAAAASGEELALVSDIMVTALSGFGLEAQQSGHVADVLAQAANKSTASIADMGETLKYVAPVARATGISLDQTAAMATIMANAGIKGSQAGTTLRTALTRLVSVPPMKALDKVGDISPKLTAIWKSAQPVPAKLAAMSKEFKNLTGDQKAAAAAQIFGTESMSGMLAVMDAGPAGVAAMTKAMANSDGQAKKMAETMLDNLSGATEQLGGSLQSLGIGIASGLTPMIRSAADFATKLANAFNGLSPSMQKTIAVTLAITAAVTFFGGAALVAAAMMIPLIGAAGGLMAVLSPLLIIVAVVAAVIALGVAFYLLYTRSETVRTGVSRAWAAMKAGIMDVLRSLKQTISVWVGWAKAFWAAYGANIKSVALKVWSGVAQYISGALNVIKGIIKTVLSVLRGDWRGAWEGIKTILSGAWQALGGIVKVGVTLLKTSWKLLWTYYTQIIPGVWSKIGSLAKAGAMKVPGLIKSAFSSLVGMMKDVGSKAGSALGDAIKSAVNYVIGRWNDLEIPSVKVKGKALTPAIGTPNLPMFAKGGVVKGAGTGTSDSILARISNGEAIIPAAIAQKYGWIVNALIDGKLPGFAAGKKVKAPAKKAPAKKPLRKPKQVGAASSNLDAARYEQDQSDPVLEQKKQAAINALNAAVAAQQAAENALPAAEAKHASAAQRLRQVKNQYAAIIGKDSAKRRLAFKPQVTKAEMAEKAAKKQLDALRTKAKKNGDARAELASTVASLESQLAPEVVAPPTALESLSSMLASGESVAGLALTNAELSTDTADDEPARKGMAAFFAGKATQLSEFLAGPGSLLSMDEQTGIRNDIASSLRSAAQYNESEGAGTGGADPSTGAQGASGGGAGSGSFMGQQVGSGGGGGSSAQVNTTGGGANGVGYVPDSDLHPVFFGTAQLNDLGWDGSSVHGVKIMSVLGWDEAEDAQSAVDNRAGQDGEIARELLMGGSTVTIKGIVSGGTLEDLYANRRILKGKLQAQASEQVLKMPDRATAGPFDTTYAASMIGYLRKNTRVVQNVTWGGAVGPYAHEFEVVMRAADPRRLDDVVVAETTGAVASGGGVEAPVEAPVSIGATGVGGSATVVNSGDYEAPFTITIEANGSPITNPIVEDLAGAWSLVFDGIVLGASDWLEIDMQNRTVLLNGTTSRFQYLDFDQTRWALLPEGSSTVRLRGSSVSDPSRAIITFRPAYL